MPIAELMQGIEATDFSAELNLASGTRAFRRRLREHALVQELRELARDAATREALANRVEELSAQEVDVRYENRFDAALSAYLTVLADTALPETIARSATAAARARNTWWTVGISHELIARAMATGLAQAPVNVRQVAQEAIVPGANWRNALTNSLQNWWAEHPPVNPTSVAARKILSVLQAAEANAQMPHAGDVIVMPLVSEEGDRPAWKRRRRPSRTRTAHIGAAGLTGRQLARA